MMVAPFVPWTLWFTVYEIAGPGWWLDLPRLVGC